MPFSIWYLCCASPGRARPARSQKHGAQCLQSAHSQPLPGPQALVGAAVGERSGAVRRAYATAAAALARQAPEAQVAKLVAEAVALYTDPGAATAPSCYSSTYTPVLRDRLSVSMRAGRSRGCL